MADKKKQLVWNFIEFLKTSQQDGTVKEDDKESLDVAGKSHIVRSWLETILTNRSFLSVQCLSEAFEIDADSTADEQQYSIKPANLLSIFEVALKTINAKKTAPSASDSTSSASPASSSKKAPSAEDKAKAESLKMEGNKAISSKSYSLAIQKYDEAIALDPTNPVYYSNRAAAYSAEGSHDKAVEDAEESLKRDPKFVRGYSRLGLVEVPFQAMTNVSLLTDL
jgi:small glutamine-rich tetratricopeptide repeat-containing protein alpha